MTQHVRNARHVMRIFGAFQIVLALAFLHRAISIMVSSLNPLFVRDVLDASLIQVGLTSGILSLATLITMYAFSASARTALIPRAIVIGFAIKLGSTIGFYFSPNLQVFFVFIALMGLSSGILHPLILTLVTLVSTPRNLERNLMLYAVSLSVSLVIGPLIESVLLVFVDLRSIFIFWSACATGGVVLSVLLLSRLGSQYYERAQQRGALDTKSSTFIRRLRKVLSTGMFIIIVVISLGTFIFHSVLVTFGGVYAREVFSASYTTVLAIFASMFFVVFLVRATLTTKPSIRRKILTLEIVMLEGAVASLLVFLSPSIEIFIIGFCLMGVLHGVAYPIIVTLIALNVDSEDLATANSVASSIPIMTGILVPPAVGSLAQSFGIQEAGLLTLVPTAIMTVLITEIVRRSSNIKVTET